MVCGLIGNESVTMESLPPLSFQAPGPYMTSSTAKFRPGQLIHHRLFEYRGVIVDVDPHFRGTEEWHANVARSQPPKDQPWYHILVHGQDLNTYVAERNLEPDETGEPIHHVEIGMFFEGMGDGGYIPRRKDH